MRKVTSVLDMFTIVRRLFVIYEDIYVMLLVMSNNISVNP